jgi:hypothetical protein
MELEQSTTADDASNKRRAANQRNSQLSPGPTSEPGKQVSSQNALKFGFFSQKALLPGESWLDFEEFHGQLVRQFAPRNEMESHVLEQYVGLAWRIKRLPEIEAGVFTRYGISVQGSQCGPALALVASVQTDNILGQLARYEATLRKNAFKCLDLLRMLHKGGWGTDASRIDAQVIDVEPGPSGEASANTSPGGSITGPLPPDQPSFEQSPEG